VRIEPPLYWDHSNVEHFWERHVTPAAEQLEDGRWRVFAAIDMNDNEKRKFREGKI
jgi:hypothetical protein